MKPVTLIVLSKPHASYLRVLERLPASTHLVVGNQPEMFDGVAAKADVIVNCFQPVGIFRDTFLRCPAVQWVHSASAGVENTLFPELIDSPVPLTNARGVFSRGLGEFAIAGALFFDKKIADMRRQQAEHRWVNMEVEELHGKTMGIVSYGSIGQAVARLAKAFGMRVIAMRRRPELSENDPLVDRMYSPAELKEMMSQSDFISVCSPLTPGTRGMIGAEEIAAMKPTAVIINVGRGPVIVESALVEALQNKKIRGAVLDVFDQEPLPSGHPFYTFDNVLLSPHSADHTPNWQDLSIEFFVDNFLRYAEGKPLENIVDKHHGY